MPYADNNGVKIFWEQQGAGTEAVLLIMGLGYTHEMWHRVAPSLAESYRVILFDNRGVGLTDAPPGPYTMSDMASDAAAVLRAAGCDQANVFGISMGGM